METDVLTSALEVMPPGTPTRLSPDVRHSEPPMHLHRPSSDRAQVSLKFVGGAALIALISHSVLKILTFLIDYTILTLLREL